MDQVSAATDQSVIRARSTAGHAPIDFAHLRRYTLNDRALEKEILDIFVAQLPLTIGELRHASVPADWKRAAHTLKGSARAVGVGSLADLAATAEQAAGLTDPAVRHAIVNRIESAAAGVAAFIATL